MHAAPHAQARAQVNRRFRFKGVRKRAEVTGTRILGEFSGSAKTGPLPARIPKSATQVVHRMRNEQPRTRFGLGAVALAAIVFVVGCATVGSDGDATGESPDEISAVSSGEVDPALVACATDAYLEAEETEADDSVNGVLPARRRAQLATEAVHNCLVDGGADVAQGTLRPVHDCLLADADELNPTRSPATAIADCLAATDVPA